MHFTSKLTGLLMIIAASAMSVQALAAVPRDAEVRQEELSVTLFDKPSISGESITFTGIEEGVSFHPRDDWLDRARSLIVSDGYTCAFFNSSDSRGDGIYLSGTNANLPTELDKAIESFTCFNF
ncbi:hypothetical protein CVT25_007663 [Psilocybe cyanescens]|uniref:Beta/gamma crystallin 'Greek key' domain-containing protein n=1 Tax=Psilocybe cyanescens TaxID=93625 RepID=A0A409VW68_PSICY|nr:hypothetical protein CVT25_007663 [Psilocybe cyanescens]